MEHSFDIDIAKEYGIYPAILLKNLHYWIEKNKANEKHFYEGKYWTYNSVKAFCLLFPYMSKKKIETAIGILKNEELIQIGNFNTSQYDRTCWYSLTEKGIAIIKNGKSIIPKWEMENTEMGNGLSENGETIPNDNTNVKTTNDNTYITIKDSYNEVCTSLPKCTVLSVKRKNAIKCRINEYGIDKVLLAIKKASESKFLNGSNNRNWIASFDWIMNNTNMAKILDGNFDNGRNNQNCNNQSNFNNNSKLSTMQKYENTLSKEEKRVSDQSWLDEIPEYIEKEEE